eukprot:TRINITY_DN962_c0_g1_i1.p1 TRINITY_DN962_c0_g1~~TRINITY_DN962_c0_g1_i1.p1  ORF type:complete len:254 (+),score=18.49 TRINITY_DN962_c0_g1_i1:104-865(+)
MGANLKLVINNKLYICMNTNKEVISNRSILFRGIFENLDFQSNQEIKLQLERPEKISILLDFIENGVISEELENVATFASYVNDIVYLGIHELETHALDMFEWAIIEKNCSQINFRYSRPIQDFMKRFIQERVKLVLSPSIPNNYQLCVLVMKWVGENNIYRSEITEILDGCINFELLSLPEIKLLRQNYPVAFDAVMQPAYLLDFWMLGKRKCTVCCQNVSRCSIGSDDCYTLDYDGVSKKRKLFKHNGSHK